MLKRMTAKFNGKCAQTGAPIYRGDDITYDTVSRKAYLLEHDDAQPIPATLPKGNKMIDQMYGCDIEAFKECVKDSITYKLSGGAMVVAGLMSDAQEMMAHGDTEQARQYLNRAKALVFDMVEHKLSFYPEEKH